jgi:hypothetical protein
VPFVPPSPSYASLRLSACTCPRGRRTATSSGAAGELLNFTTTIVNNTESAVSVRDGGIRVDGHVALPRAVAPTSKGLKSESANRSGSSEKCPDQRFFGAPAEHPAFTTKAHKAFLTISANWDIEAFGEGIATKGRALPFGKATEVLAEDTTSLWQKTPAEVL